MKIELSDELKTLINNVAQEFALKALADHSDRLAELETRVSALEAKPEPQLNYKKLLFDHKGRVVLVFDDAEDSKDLVYARRDGSDIEGYHVQVEFGLRQHEEFLMGREGWSVCEKYAARYFNATREALHALFDKVEKELGR